MKALATSAIVILSSLALAASASAQCCGPKAKQANKSDKVAAACCQKGGNACSPACSPAKCGDKARCCGSAKCAEKAQCGAKTRCSGRSLMATGMPLMSYKVGDETTSCPKQATDLATKGNATVSYVVDTKSYGDKSKAMQAYTKSLHNHLDEMMAVKYAVGSDCVGCPHAARAMAKKAGCAVRYQVATFSFDDHAKAEQAVKVGRSAAEKVSLEMVVEGRKYTCAKSARQACNAEGKGKARSCTYVVGNTQTTCEVTAQVNLAQARIQAAHSAIQTLANRNSETAQASTDA